MDVECASVVAIQSEIAEKLNFACHQSAFAILRDLRIQNESHDLRQDDLVVTLSSNPPFLKPKSWKIDSILPEGTTTINDRDILLDGKFLMDLRESIAGVVSIKVEQDGVVLVEENKKVELLANNEWGGASYMPELLASFSLPNDPVVDRIIREASKVLKKAGKNDQIDGYRSKSRQRVWEIVSSIYTSIANLGISYALPPASFEQNGQKIRLPNMVFENRLATCLDTTMLFASVFEQVGLNPVIILPAGHAMIGVWLQPDVLANIVIHEAETLRKRVQLQEFLVFETTCVTSQPANPFSRAVAEAEQKILPKDDLTFNSAVDIRRARSHRIMPLGLIRDEKTILEGSEDEQVIELAFEDAPTLPDFDDGVEEDVPETPKGRLERWQRKLLDLSARNPLLNHKSTKTSLQFFCPEPGLLEDKLSENKRISIRSVSDNVNQKQDEGLHRQRTGEILSIEYAKDALEKNQVLVELPENELTSRSVNIFRKAQMALQEGGANTLYLALGFLLWKRKENDDRRFKAPLILMPVTIERKSVRSGVKILSHDDEPRFNTTLLEMLRKDFLVDIPNLDGELPKDHSGIDVNGIWNIVRKAVKDVPGFEVIEDVVLAHFSFAKYLMWKDLVDRTEELRNNQVVKHLLDTPRDPYPSDVAFVDPNNVDQIFKPSDLLVPLPADSSQMAAIATADRGKDFIIIGPPGTGKSQTISNLIAHMLGKGKTVLFVSEKTAALDVVSRRMRDIGLGRFCMELHSNKARKLDVLNQLRDAWEYKKSNDVTAWKKEADRLCSLRDKLNTVVDRLHVPRKNGMTAHYAMGIKVRDEELASRVQFSWGSLEQHDENLLEEMRSAVEKLSVQIQAIGDVSDSPFHLIANGDWSPQWEQEVCEHARLLSKALSAIECAFNSLIQSIGIELSNCSLSQLDAIAELASVLLESYRKPTSYALESDGKDRVEALEDAITHLRKYADAQAGLSCAYEPTAWRNLDGNELIERWNNASETWWPKRYFSRRGVIKDMRIGGARSKPNPVQDAPVLIRLREEGEAIDRLDAQLSCFKEWEGHTTNPDVALELQKLGQNAQAAVGKIAENPQDFIAIRGKIRILMDEGNDLLEADAVVGKTAKEYLTAHQAFKEACQSFEIVAGQSIGEYFSNDSSVLTVMKERMDNISSRYAELREWCGWCKRRAQAVDLGLIPLVTAIENGTVPEDEILDTFNAAYCTWWSRMIIGEDDVLRNFSTPEHISDIAKFCEIDNRFQKLTAEYSCAKLCGNLPGSEDTSRQSSWGTLRRELQKKARHKPVRQLVSEIPDVLTTLAPCLMMSPLSVAQYLPANQALFDVVIFDEASQITVWDAVGALARGRQVIIAGDPKQMPPTNFFARTDDDPDGDVNSEGDLESILDEMLGACIPEQKLNLHYRSRRESLIAFSNSRYYDNALVTFPAPVYPDNGVRLISPEGFYARGGARNNQGEAKAIVSEILLRLKHEDPDIRNRSIGVVTFNTEQQSLIENLLDDARSKDPSIEWAFSDETALEPVFVKNLETVQGDERDVILFSITYGPDQSGHMTMNFGPLNRDGGERRLNVAMTRSRIEMLVFSTLKAEQINLSRTQARGVMDLKHFLEFAERGSSALGASVYGSLGDFESPFEVAVARELRNKGWEVHPQIGVSAYRIDLGISHPDYPGVYLAGVECDGAMYHSSAFARERDKIRQSVLEGLGWKLFRVWSTDWWTNRAKAISGLDIALRDHLALDREKMETADGNNNDEVQTDLPPKENVDFVQESQVTNVASNSSELNEAQDSPDMTVANENATSVVGDCEYVIALLDDERFSADPEAFYSSEYQIRLCEIIDRIIEIEGPIHESVLIRRVARHHGFKRAGRQIKEIVTQIAKERHVTTTEDVGTFYWFTENGNTVLSPSRYKNRNDEMRKVEFLCREEILAINELLNTGEDSVALARKIGIARLNKVARERLDSILCL